VNGARVALGDFYLSEPLPDLLNAGEAADIAVPTPRREINPSVACDGQRQINGPAKIQNALMLGAQAASSACERSARMSSSCSIPIDSRT
jgi:hypothetical protein